MSSNIVNIVIDGTETELERCKKLREQAIATAVERTQERDRARSERDAAARELAGVLFDRDYAREFLCQLVAALGEDVVQRELGVDPLFDEVVEHVRAWDR